MEKRLLNNCRSISRQFVNITQALFTMKLPFRWDKVDPSLTKGFIHNLHEYFESFESWRRIDAQVQGARVLNALRALKRLTLSTPEEATQVRDFTEKLRGKVPIFLGSTALAQFDQESVEEQVDNNDDRDDVVSRFAQLSHDEQIHEVLINPTIKFSAINHLEHKVLRDLLWTNIQVDLACERPYVTKIVKVLEAFGERKIWTGSFKRRVNNLIDAEHIKAQFLHNAFTAKDFKTLFLDMVQLIKDYGNLREANSMITPLKMCGYDTTRLMSAIDLIDTESAICKSAVHITESLRLIYEFMDTLSLTCGNLRIQYISAAMYQQGVEKEQTRFKTLVDTKGVKLVLTSAWLSTTIGFGLSDGLIQKENTKVVTPYADICKIGLVYLVTTDVVERHLFAETLTMDVDNILNAQKVVLRVMHGYVLYVTMLEVIKTSEETVQARIKNTTEYLFTTDTKLATKELFVTMVTLLTNVKLLTANQLVVLSQCVSNNIVNTSPVYQICLKRIRRVLLQLIKKETPGNVPAFVVDRLKTVMDRIVRIAELNVQVYSSYYNEVLATLV